MLLLVDHNPNNGVKKRSNPFKKMFDDMKNLVKKDGEDNKQSSLKESKSENQESKNSKREINGKKEVKRSTREKRGNNKEQKLPKNLKKGW